MLVFGMLFSGTSATVIYLTSEQAARMGNEVVRTGSLGKSTNR